MAEPPTTPEPTPSSDSSEVKVPEGTVDAERAGYVSELIAYRVVDHLAVAIANRVKKFLDSATSRVLLVDDPQFASGGTALNEIRGQISLIESGFGQCERENKRLLADEPSEEEGQAQTLGFIPTLTAGLGFLPEIAKGAGAVAEVLSYFRSDYKIVDRDFDVKTLALVCSVADALVERNFTVFIPGFYSTGESTVLANLARLSELAVRLKTQRDVLAAKLPASEPKKTTEEEGAQASGDKKRLGEIGAAVLETDAALASLAALRTSWMAVPTGQTQTMLEKAISRERIDALGITHLLMVGNLSSGGEASTRDRLIGKDKVGFLGGAVIAFALTKLAPENLEEDGKLLAVDTLPQYGVMGGKLDDYVGQSDTIRYVWEYQHGKYRE